MRLGGPVYADEKNPEAYALAHKQKGYKAAYCPGHLKAGQGQLIGDFVSAMKKHDIVVAEVGAWCNPLSKDAKKAEEGINHVIERLTLADEINAATCVNVLGSWHESCWYGPFAEGYGSDFFDYAVEVSRKIIDAVKPTRTKMSFEIMPYIFLDSAPEYERFLKALDRKEAGVHFDPANCICSPRVFFGNADFLSETVKQLGGRILSVHLKDIQIRSEPVTVMFDEVPIGTGGLDYVSLLTALNKLPSATPMMLEHLENEQQYDQAAAAVRKFAETAGVTL